MQNLIVLRNPDIKSEVFPLIITLPFKSEVCPYGKLLDLSLKPLFAQL